MENQSPTQGNGASKGKFGGWFNISVVISRAIALSLDPLFFFIPVIHEDKKCISEDKKMWIIAVFCRSFLDFIYLAYFLVRFCNDLLPHPPSLPFIQSRINKKGESSLKKEKNEASNTTSAKQQRYSWMRFMIDILAILPIPQVLISIILPEMRHAKYTDSVTILNAVILVQYAPRVLQIYLSLKDLDEFDISIRIKAFFNFFLYLLAAYLAGAFWYFYSIQRLTSCSRKACLHHGGCSQGFFNCDHSSGNLSVLYDFCSIDSTNTSTFDFGIFLEARQSGILESKDFPKKLIYCACWGLRNLSSFGSTLETSTDIWENFFALGVSIFGLLLFLYFLGNLQAYMQDGASESIKISKVGKLLRKLRQLYKERPSKSIENSENDKNLALDDADVDKLLTELEKLYKQCIASKSEKDAVQKSDVGNLLIKLAEIYKQPASTSIENSETDKNVVEKLGRELGQLYRQCKDAVQPKSDGAVAEAASISEPV